MDIFNILFIMCLFYFSLTADIDWRDYPACKIGRLQSPIKLNEYESIYANNFSFVYQSYKGCECDNIEKKYAYIADFSKGGGGYINFERGGVIKQYEFIRAEVYNKSLHEIDGEKGDYELHLIHKKNLDFVTNKNQYRSIQDPNIYLVIVLRYSKCPNNEKKACISDNGLLAKLTNKESDSNKFKIDLGAFNVFQDKRAYFYEGSFVHIPCDENVNYYVVKDLFYFDENKIDNTNFKDIDATKIEEANRFGRPVYKNFMNYREVLKNDYFSFKKLIISFLFIIILL